MRLTEEPAKRSDARQEPTLGLEANLVANHTVRCTRFPYDTVYSRLVYVRAGK